MLYLIPVFIFIDFISKYLANNYLVKHINLVSDFVYLQLVKNQWIAFSIDIPLLKIITIILIVIIVKYYLKYEKEKNNSFIDLSFSLILWWAIWNARERIINSNVTDFIWIKYFSIFNFADIFLCVWVILYIYTSVFKNNLIVQKNKN